MGAREKEGTSTAPLFPLEQFPLAGLDPAWLAALSGGPPSQPPPIDACRTCWNTTQYVVAGAGDGERNTTWVVTGLGGNLKWPMGGRI